MAPILLHGSSAGSADDKAARLGRHRYLLSAAGEPLIAAIRKTPEGMSSRFSRMRAALVHQTAPVTAPHSRSAALAPTPPAATPPAAPPDGSAVASARRGGNATAQRPTPGTSA